MFIFLEYLYTNIRTAVVMNTAILRFLDYNLIAIAFCLFEIVLEIKLFLLIKKISRYIDRKK